MNNGVELRFLAKTWRDLATTIEVKHGLEKPVKASCVVSAYQQCAEELEEKTRELEEKNKP